MRLSLRAAFVTLAFLAAVAVGAPVSGGETAAPSGKQLIEELSDRFAASSRAMVLKLTVQTQRSARVIEFGLWTSGDERGLLRVTAPQVSAGRAVLRLGRATYAYEPGWDTVRRVGSEGQRCLEDRMLFLALDLVVGQPLPARYRPLDVIPADGHPEPAWTLRLLRKPDVDAMCVSMEVDLLAEGFAPVEARCTRAGGEMERWRFGEFRDVGGRRHPTEIVVERVGEGGWRATLEIVRGGYGDPVDERLFSLTSLAEQE